MPDSKSKTYIIDSSVFLAFPYALRVFEENNVVIPRKVLRDMSIAAKATGDNRWAAIEFGREIDSLVDGAGADATMDGGGRLEIYGDSNESVIEVAMKYMNEGRDRQPILVSRDPIMRVTARSLGLYAEPFKHEVSEYGDYPYIGRSILYLFNQDFREFFAKKGLDNIKQRTFMATQADGMALPEGYRLTNNEYVQMVDASNPQGSVGLGRYSAEKDAILPLLYKSPCDVDPRNVGQKFALDALMDPDIPLVILRGPAGTAKSFLSVAAGLDQVTKKAQDGKGGYRRLLLTRPNTKMDNDIGYLKGDEKAKVMPILRGLLDNIEILMGNYQPTDYLLDKGIVEAQAMAYMRGRSIPEQFIIADEMQNSTPTQALSITSRAGEGSKIVLCGDTQQIDSPFLDEKTNGLSFVADRMKGSSLCCQVSFLDTESTRSPLAKEAVERMGGAVLPE